MNLATVSIKRPTFIAAIIVVMLVVGSIFMSRMSVDMFPDVNFPYISVTTIYPGAGPQEMETLVSKILEEQISSISGLKNVTSINQDSVSVIISEFTLETNQQYAEDQVKAKLAQVRNQLPRDAQEPIIRKYDPADRPIMTFSLTGSLPPAKLYDLADTIVKNGLEQVKDVGNVEIIGGTKREIHVDIDRNKLKEYETSLSMVANRIGGNSQNIPIGSYTEGDRELIYRSIGEFRSIDQINKVIVSFYGSDVPITINKIGRVVDTVQKVRTLGYLNGKSALLVDVYKRSGANTVDVSDNLQKKMLKLNNTLKISEGAPGLNLVKDNARAIRLNLNDMKMTIYEGILLAIIVVYLFLGNFRSTFITAMALPNSLIGAFIFMGLAGFTVNMLSLMALSLAVGLLIDDAIVVRENIFRHVEGGMHPMKAAQLGTDEVRLAVIATTLTIIAVFLPVGFLQGMVGQFFKQFGLTVVFAMSISLFDALTVAPMLSAYLISSKPNREKRTLLSEIVYLPSRWFNVLYSWIQRIYELSIRYTLKHKVIVLLAAVLIFVLSLGSVTKIPKTFMPTQDFGEFFVNLEEKPGTSLLQMNKDAVAINELLSKEKDIEAISLSVGDSREATNVASMFIRMVPSKDRKRTTSEFKEYVRKLLEPYRSTLNPTVNDVGMAGEGNPFQLVIAGNDLQQLASLSQDWMEKFKTIRGLVDLNTNYKPGSPEFQIQMNPEKMVKLGVQSITAGMELRGMVEGMLPAKYRENGMEYDIRVQLQEDQKNLKNSFDRLYVPNVNYQLVKLKNIADPVETTGPLKIYHRNRSRYIQITGNLSKDGAIGDVTAAAKKILAKEKIPEGVSYEFVGSSELFEELFTNMVLAGGLSIIFIYLVLASLYESLVVPFTIMLALPLAIIGGLLALLLTGQTINMLTMIGFIMLLGLSTKNSILLVDYTQRLMRTGMERNEALIKAGMIRLRPILMTTFALIAGMLPLAIGLSEIGGFRKSMGIAVIGGLFSSTILTLIVIPAVFGYLDSFRLWTRKILGRPPLREIDKSADPEV